MKIKIASACFVIGALLAPLALHAAESNGGDGDRAHPKAFVKDSFITTKIKARLAEERPGSLARVKVDTRGRGTVTLSGSVRSRDEAERAVSIARATDGVRTVSNHLRIVKRNER
ncbi:MAG TPA: BON domain-containing protein [Ramlibacter sp.]|uniref:BON domain-containing protein n=1 Tax=Ramlibacter sp. TaxID=1917967 RepID=UPI002D1A833F|nr:BON domain-containing protein [Ramlibacter sp.]HVZ45708.1 BON domain-containing protein [Ramlibacter sp.]